MTSHTGPGFELLIQNLQNVGFFKFFLPWALILAVTYGILRKIELFDDEAVDATVSIVFSFLALFGVYSIIPLSFFAQTFGILTIILVFILSLVIALGAGGVDVTEMDDEHRWKLVTGFGFVVLSIALWAFRDVLGITALFNQLFAPPNLAIFLMVAAFFVVLFLLFYHSGD